MLPDARMGRERLVSDLEAMEREYRLATHFPMRTIRPMWKPSMHTRSLDNFSYSNGGDRPLPEIDLGWNQEARIGSLDNALHAPGGGQGLIFHQKLNWRAFPKVGSLDNIDYDFRKTSYLPKSFPVLPEIGKVYYGAKAEKCFEDVHYEVPDAAPVVTNNKKYDYIRAKVGSLKNIHHSPRGGDLKVYDEMPTWRSKAKVGSLDNASHIAGGGNVKIMDEKAHWKADSKIGSLDNAKHVPKQSSVKIQKQKLDWTTKSKIGSLDNYSHKPGGGDVQIVDKKVHWKAKSKVGALEAARAYDRASPVDRHGNDPKIPFFLM